MIPVLHEYHWIFLILKNQLIPVVQVLCLIHGIKVNHLEIYSVKGETLDIIVNTVIICIKNSNMIKLFGFCDVKNMLW